MNIYKRNIIVSCALFMIFSLGVSAQVTELTISQPPIIQAPSDSSQWASFRKALLDWRVQIHENINYDASLYDREDFQWVKSAFNCCFLMMYDQNFYDRERNCYTVEKILAEGRERFGGYDIVVLWHAYPRIGLDNRNQFDFYRDMPGGLTALKKVAEELHEQGVKVYINYNPWDTGTRREGTHDIDALATVIKSIGADGIFLDTMDRSSEEFRQKLDMARMGVVLESELALPIEEISTHHMSWAQWFVDSAVPGILRSKWIEPRHIQHGISRWTGDKSKELQTAWMNGSGMMIWENVFGQWAGWSPRDCYILKTMYGIQHYFSHIFTSNKWIPLVNNTLLPNVYANLWYDDNCQLWTLVNRAYVQAEGPLLQITPDRNYVYYDLIKGQEVFPNASGIIEGQIIPRGIGCILAFKKNRLPDNFDELLSSQATIYKEKTYNIEYPQLEAILTPVSATKPYKNVPRDMVVVDGYEGEIPVTFNCREIGYYHSLEYDFINRGPVVPHQKVTFSRNVTVKRIAIDSSPVTNAQYKEFLHATNYQPRFSENFLKHWINGEIPVGTEQEPVVYVDLDDARAYAKWVGKRLPREEEWQLAIKQAKGKKQEMHSNTWEMTESEYNDGRNRFCILKGGSEYKAEGSDWYFDGGFQTEDFAAKQLLLYPGIDRCSTVGFRCVVDLD
ncbi:MAG: hypothetical protein EGQ20_08830 [Bacteroides oleiciplenus]|nr:hypothetical protein [Bacteroides oleiciplenus]